MEITMKMVCLVIAASVLTVSTICPADSTAQEVFAGTERVLLFPDYSLGELMLKDIKEGQLREYAWWGQDDQWRDGIPAKGRVVIPPGKHVNLIISSHVWTTPEKLAPLKQLKPDDLYHLVLSGGYGAPDTPPPTDACIPYITHLTGLKELDLSQSHITEEGLRQLSVLSSLEFLRTPEGLTDRGLSEIAKIRSLQALYIGSLGHNRLSDRALTMLQRLPNLKTLGLSDPGLTNQALRYVAGIRSLESLALCPPFSDEGLRYLITMPRLKTVHLFQLNITDTGLEHIAKIRTLENVNLPLIGTVTDKGIHALAKLPRFKVLYADRAILTDESLRTLSNITALESLTLSRNRMTEEGLTGLGKLKQLKRLALTGSYPGPVLTDHTLKVISGLENLEDLHIGGSGFTDQGMTYLGRMKRLRRLSLSTAPGVTDAGIAELHQLGCLEYLQWPQDTQVTLEGINRLRELKSLKDVTFSNIRRGDATLDISGMEKLENIILSLFQEQNRDMGGLENADSFTEDDWACFSHLKNLQRLQIGGKGVSDVSLGHLRGLENLLFLNIHGPTAITDDGLTHLAGMKKLNRLTINHGHFTDHALMILAEMNALRWLELHSDTAFSNKAIEQFRQKRNDMLRLIIMP